MKRNSVLTMINILNRTDNSENISAADSRVMRFWSPEWVLKQLRILREYGIHVVDSPAEIGKKVLEINNK